MKVHQIEWPAAAARRNELRKAGLPRLLLVAADGRPPITESAIEDWVRLPAAREEVEVRMETLRRAAQSFQVAPVVEDGLLRFRGRSVGLPVVESRVAGSLVEQFGSVVSREQLSRAAWDSNPPGRNALDVHILRLRRRLEPLRLQIRTIRSRGYVLEAS